MSATVTPIVMMRAKRTLPIRKDRRLGDRYSITDAKYVVLRNEIIEAQRSETEFLKWKLIAVAAVSSIAIGSLASKADLAATDLRLIVCLAPLICAFADMVTLDLTVRIRLLAGFLRLCGDSYEKHIANLRGRKRNPFYAAATASFTASLVIDLLVMFGGALVGSKEGWDSIPSYGLVAAGCIGIVATLCLWYEYFNRLDQISPREGPTVDAQLPAVRTAELAELMLSDAVIKIVRRELKHSLEAEFELGELREALKRRVIKRDVLH